ncbi:MAG TPA: dolichyl-phosphate beta-glucosyltransferase [Terriglobales bacterium]
MINRMYSFVIPAYNESQRLAPTLDKVLAHVAERGWNAEILVVNDGSKDNTADIIRDYAARYPIVRLIENPGNRGKGYAVRNGMLHASGDILLMTDADLSSPITEASKLFAAIENGADIAIGSRWINPSLQTVRQPWYRQLGGRVFNLVIRIILGLRQKDTQCGFKAFTRAAAQTLFPLQQIDRWGFDPELLFIAKKFQMKIAEIGVEWAHDDRSKINPLRDGFRIVNDAIQVRKNAWAGKYGTAHRTTAVARS